METAPKKAMLVVFLVVVIDLLGFGIVLPLMPRYASVYMGGMDATTQGIVIGLLYSTFSLMQFLFSPMWGRLSDRIGRRPVLLVSLSGSVVFYGLFGFAATLPSSDSTLALTLLMVSRIGAGIAGASVSTAAAVIADCTPKEKRAKGMALVGVAFGIGFTLGPIIAYLGLELFNDAKYGPGALAAGLSFLALLYAFAKFPETRNPQNAPGDRKLFSVGQTMEVVRNPAIGPLVLIYFCAIFAFANFEATLSLFTQSAFGMGDKGNFLLFAYVGFMLMLAQGGLYRRLAGKLPEVRLLAYGVGAMLVGIGALAALALANQQLQGSVPNTTLQPAFYVALAIAVFGFAFVNPSISAMVSKRADPARQGEVQGVSQSFASLGRILGPFVGSVVFQWHPSRALPYVVAAATLFFVIGLLPLARRGEPSSSDNSAKPV
jgi:MFS family permease